MPVSDAPDDENVRQSYNFAPGYHGLVYRADGRGHGSSRTEDQGGGEDHKQSKAEHDPVVPAEGHPEGASYKLQAMQWGKSRIGWLAGTEMMTLTRQNLGQDLYPSGRSAIPTMGPR